MHNLKSIIDKIQELFGVLISHETMELEAGCQNCYLMVQQWKTFVMCL